MLIHLLNARQRVVFITTAAMPAHQLLQLLCLTVAVAAITPARPRVAVIGAGVSGLNCARKLQPNCDVTVFEASDGVGGRVRSDREGGYVFDRGFAAASVRMVLKRCLSERGGREKRF